MNLLILDYWFYIGTLYLIILTYQDYKNKMMVDDRHNYFMMGLSLSLQSHTNQSLLYLICLIVIVIVGQFFIRKYDLIGSGDVSALMWLFFGYGIIAPNALMAFVFVYGMLSLLQKGGEKLLNIPFNTHHFPILLISFIITNIFLGGY